MPLGARAVSRVAGLQRNRIARREMDGIPVYTVGGPGPVRAALIFRIGHADETLPTTGITHLVEHLALFPFGQQPYGFNGTVDIVRTVFFAAGTADEVRGHLEQIATNLRALPLDRLTTEAKILLDEARRRQPSPADHHAWLRYGARGPGLAFSNEFGLHGATGDAVQAWADSHFTAGNAAIVWVGPKMPEFKLGLLPGNRVPLVEPLELVRSRAWALGPDDGVGLSFSLARTSAGAAGQRILASRLQQAIRFEGGLSYGVVGAYQPTSASRALSVMWATAQRKDIDQLADAVSTTLRRIADEGPTVEELAVDLDGWRRSLDNPESRQAEAHRLAIQELFGAERETFDDLDRSMVAVTPEDARSRFREAYASAIMTLPRGVPAGKRGFTSYPSLIEGRPSGKHFTNVDEPRVALGHRQLAQLVVGTDEMGLEAPAGNGLRIRFEEAAGLILAPNGVATVVHNSGADIAIDPRRWRNGEAAVRLVERALPKGRQVRLLALDDVERKHGRRSRSHLSRSRLRMTIAALLALASLALLVIGQPLLDLGLQYGVKFPSEGFINGFSWSGVLILVGAALVGSAAIAAWQFEPFVWTAGTVAVPVLIVGSIVGMVAQSAPQDAIPMGIALALRVYVPSARARVGGQV